MEPDLNTTPQCYQVHLKSLEMCRDATLLLLFSSYSSFRRVFVVGARKWERLVARSFSRQKRRSLRLTRVMRCRVGLEPDAAAAPPG
ncbi:hypothetical protein EYF80_060599 [Liparis tanakae]|uniref:Uncharacterized protein n=1 Tax=Liparis tanakae TaxID=230148 RepID=A0A4Z2EKB0_9TELE|nr:hypothetical protein EYF80_060599 [Liparis tanakae]